MHQNSKRNTGEDGEQVDYSIDAECTLLDCEGVSVDNLGQMEALQYKYEEMKSQLPGKHIFFQLCNSMKVIQLIMHSFSIQSWGNSMIQLQSTKILSLIFLIL